MACGLLCADTLIKQTIVAPATLPSELQLDTTADAEFRLCEPERIKFGCSKFECLLTERRGIVKPARRMRRAGQNNARLLPTLLNGYGSMALSASISVFARTATGRYSSNALIDVRRCAIKRTVGHKKWNGNGFRRRPDGAVQRDK
jgi:hypothetical protein